MSANATKWAWDQKAGGDTEKVVLLALADWASPHEGHDHEVCWYSQKSISVRCECSPKTVERALAKLEACRLIKRAARYNPKSRARISDFIYLNINGALTFDGDTAGNLTAPTRQNDGGYPTDKLTAPTRQNDAAPPVKLSEEPKKKNLKENLRNPKPLSGASEEISKSGEGKERRPKRISREDRRAAREAKHAEEWEASRKVMAAAVAAEKARLARQAEEKNHGRI